MSARGLSAEQRGPFKSLSGLRKSSQLSDRMNVRTSKCWAMFQRRDFRVCLIVLRSAPTLNPIKRQEAVFVKNARTALSHGPLTLQGSSSFGNFSHGEKQEFKQFQQKICGWKSLFPSNG